MTNYILKFWLTVGFPQTFPEACCHHWRICETRFLPFPGWSRNPWHSAQFSFPIKIIIVRYRSSTPTIWCYLTTNFTQSQKVFDNFQIVSYVLCSRPTYSIWRYRPKRLFALPTARKNVLQTPFLHPRPSVFSSGQRLEITYSFSLTCVFSVWTKDTQAKKQNFGWFVFNQHFLDFLFIFLKSKTQSS